MKTYVKNIIQHHLTTSIVVLLFSTVLYSCNSMSKSLAEEGYGKHEGYLSEFQELRYDVPEGKYNYAPTPTILRTPDGYALSSFSNEQVERYNEELRIRRLEYKKVANPSKQEKYDRMLQEEISKMKQKRSERISQRKTFLQGFYADLFQLPQNEFTEKYRKHCSKNICDALRTIYENAHQTKGYAWTVFGDNKMHSSSDFSFTQPEGDSQDANEKYPYSWQDNFWYNVGMGENIVKVKVVGSGKDIVIISLINPLLDIALDNNTEVI